MADPGLMKEAFENLKGALIILSLGQLPSTHPAVLISEGKEDTKVRIWPEFLNLIAKDYIDENTASLWWAGNFSALQGPTM